MNSSKVYQHDELKEAARDTGCDENESGGKRLKKVAKVKPMRERND